MSDKWQDIKSAPKDGTVITIFEKGYEDTLCQGMLHNCHYRENVPENLKGWYYNGQKAFIQDPHYWLPQPEVPQCYDCLASTCKTHIDD